MHPATLKTSNHKLRIGKFNILAIALMCTVVSGMLLLGITTDEQSDHEMQQYLMRATAIKPIKFTPHYNPFALASNNPIDSTKPLRKNWVITDSEYEKSLAQGRILEDFLDTNTTAKSAASSPLNTTPIKAIFDKLEPIKRGIQEHFSSTQRWPTQLEQLGFDSTSIDGAALELYARGKFTAKLYTNAEIIEFSPTSGHGPVRWFCQTSLRNSLLGSGNQRRCFHNSRLRNSQQDG